MSAVLELDIEPELTYRRYSNLSLQRVAIIGISNSLLRYVPFSFHLSTFTFSIHIPTCVRQLRGDDYTSMCSGSLYPPSLRMMELLVLLPTVRPALQLQTHSRLDVPLFHHRHIHSGNSRLAVVRRSLISRHSMPPFWTFSTIKP